MASVIDWEVQRVTWTPVVGRIWKPFSDSQIEHGPGAVFTPSGNGGGGLTWEEPARRGFRSRTITITKKARS